jgi:hypothetical protein
MITNKDLFFVRMLAKMSANMDNGLRCKHASLLTVNKKIFSMGFNSTKSHPEQAKFKRPVTYIVNTSDVIPYNYLHAEIDCLKNIQEINGRRSTLYVVRVDNKGQLANSKPCSGCESKIRSIKGLNRVVYSVQGGIAEYFVNN